MFCRHKNILAILVIMFIISVCNHAKADTVVLTFEEGLQDFEEPRDFYNGGFGDMGSGPGPRYGITFAVAGKDFSVLTDDFGFFFNEPTSPNVLDVCCGDITTNYINVLPGFTEGFSFFHSSFDENVTGTVSIFDGLNATGNLLAVGTFTPTSRTFTFFSISFSGTARSILVNSSDENRDSLHFDNMTFANVNPIPEPTTMLLLGTGLAGLSVAIRKRRNKCD